MLKSLEIGGRKYFEYDWLAYVRVRTSTTFSGHNATKAPMGAKGERHCGIASKSAILSYTTFKEACKDIRA